MTAEYARGASWKKLGNITLVIKDDYLIRSRSNNLKNSRSQVYVSKLVRDSISKFYHNAKGHPRRATMLDQIRKRWYWPRCAKDVDKHARECHNCPLCSFKDEELPVQPLRPTRPLQLVEWDLSGPMTGHKGDKCLVLVMIDIFT